MLESVRSWVSGRKGVGTDVTVPGTDTAKAGEDPSNRIVTGTDDMNQPSTFAPNTTGAASTGQAAKSGGESDEEEEEEDEGEEEEEEEGKVADESEAKPREKKKKKKKKKRGTGKKTRGGGKGKKVRTRGRRGDSPRSRVVRRSYRVLWIGSGVSVFFSLLTILAVLYALFLA